jgi:hypothetical protein
MVEQLEQVPQADSRLTLDTNAIDGPPPASPRLARER